MPEGSLWPRIGADRGSPKTMSWSMGAVYNCTWVLNTLPQVYHGSLGVIVVINKPWDLIFYIERKPWENEPYKPEQKQDGRLESAFYIGG